MFAEIIPFIRMPYGNTTFTYKVPPELEGSLSIGQFVEIPFRKKAQFGAVAKMTSTPPKNFPVERLSTITRSLEEPASWNETIIACLLNFAHLYHCSPATLAKLLSPSIPTKIHRDVKKSEPLKRKTPSINLDDSIAVKGTSETIIYHTLSEKISLYSQLLKKRTLLLTPQIHEAEELQALLSLPHDKHILWDNSLPKNAQWNLWQQMRDSAQTIITTRSGIFTPLQQIEQIIIDSPETSDHKSWEASPHYDIRAMASFLAESLSIPLIQVSLSPRIANSTHWRTLPSKPAPIHSILHQSGSNPIHENLIEKAKATIAKNQHCVFIRNAKYDASTLRCLDCKQQWLCPENHGTLHLRDQALVCSSCSHSLPVPRSCPTCRGQRIKAFGLGIDGIAEWIKQSYTSVHIVTAKTIENLELSTPSFLVMTPYLLKKLYAIPSSHSIGMITFLHPEDLLFLPDYRSNEWFYQSVQWHRSIAKDYFDQELIVQTRLEQDHQSFQSALTGDIHSFRQDELQSRKLLSYPPFSRLITITIKVSDMENKGQIGQFSREIQGSTTYPVSGPYPRFRNKKIYAYSWQIKQMDKNKENLDKILKSAYSKAIVEINPEQVL